MAIGSTDELDVQYFTVQYSVGGERRNEKKPRHTWKIIIIRQLSYYHTRHNEPEYFSFRVRIFSVGAQMRTDNLQSFASPPPLFSGSYFRALVIDQNWLFRDSEVTCSFLTESPFNCTVVSCGGKLRRWWHTLVLMSGFGRRKAPVGRTVSG